MICDFQIQIELWSGRCGWNDRGWIASAATRVGAKFGWTPVRVSRLVFYRFIHLKWFNSFFFNYYLFFLFLLLGTTVRSRGLTLRVCLQTTVSFSSEIRRLVKRVIWFCRHDSEAFTCISSSPKWSCSLTPSTNQFSTDWKMNHLIRLRI